MEQSDVFDAATQKYIDLLKKKISENFKCPICDHENFGVVPGYFRHTIQRDKQVSSLGGPGLNTMMLICQHCGYILEFSIATLEQEADE